MLAKAITAEVLSWVSARAGAYADVVIADRVFGGRYGESPQRISSASWFDTDLRIEFDPSEVLTITGAENFHIQAEELIVPKANQVVFGWHYYGGPRTQENWCELRYVFSGGKVSITTVGPTPGFDGFFTVASVAVRLVVGMFRPS